MKRLIYSAFVLVTLTFVLSSCDEDKYLEWKYLNETWLEQHKNDPGFVQTESGLCYKVIHQGATRRPNSSSIIYVKYKGELVTGKVFEDTKDKVINFQLSSLMPGWIEGVTKMNVGGRYIFYIPYELAYGEDGSGSIPPYSTLIFDITLDGSDDQLPND